MLCIIAKGSCDTLLCLQMLVLTMYRNRILRLHERINQLYLFLAGMSRYMNILENYICSLAVELVNDIRYILLISRNRM